MAILNKTLNTLERPGEFRLTDVVLTSSSGIKVDITDVITTFNIFANAYTPFITGRLTFADVINLADALPLLGEETITYKFYTPGLDSESIDTTGHPMKVTRLSSVKLNETSQGYYLEFASPEFKRNNRVRSISPLRGTHSDMVESILRYDLKTSKDISLERTQENFKIVSPNIPPISLIQQIADRSTSSNFNETGYFFYEDFFNTFHFRTFASMVNETPGVPRKPTLIYHVAPETVNELYTQMTRVKSFDLDRSYDHTENTRSGMYASKLMVHDTDAKTYKEYNFRYDTFFDKSYHTDMKSNKDNKIAYDGPVDEYGNKLYDFSSSKLYAVVDGGDRVYNEGDNYPYKAPNLQTTIQQRLSREQSLKNITLSLTVHGCTALNIGQVIEFTIPSMSRYSSDDNVSKLYSGRYVITKLRHSVTIGGSPTHETIIECVKDSLGSTVISNTETHHSISSKKQTSYIENESYDAS